MPIISSQISLGPQFVLWSNNDLIYLLKLGEKILILDKTKRNMKDMKLVIMWNNEFGPRIELWKHSGFKTLSVFNIVIYHGDGTMFSGYFGWFVII